MQARSQGDVAAGRLAKQCLKACNDHESSIVVDAKPCEAIITTDLPCVSVP